MDTIPANKFKRVHKVRHFALEDPYTDKSFGNRLEELYPTAYKNYNGTEIDEEAKRLCFKNKNSKLQEPFALPISHFLSETISYILLNSKRNIYTKVFK